LLLGALVVVGVYFSGGFSQKEKKQTSHADIVSGHTDASDDKTSTLNADSVTKVVARKEAHMLEDAAEVHTIPVLSSPITTLEDLDEHPEGSIGTPQTLVREKDKVVRTDDNRALIVDHSESENTQTVADQDSVAAESSLTARQTTSLTDSEISDEVLLTEPAAGNEVPVIANNATQTTREPLVLVVAILPENEDFSGTALKQALESAGLQYGEMQIFHYFNGADMNNTDNHVKTVEPVFSVASLLEPGTFALDNMHGQSIPGVTLFCQLPGTLSADEALALMLDKAHNIAQALQGTICDEQRVPFTEDSYRRYQQRISDFNATVPH
jgi:cell division protein ZipA